MHATHSATHARAHAHAPAPLTPHPAHRGVRRIRCATLRPRYQAQIRIGGRLRHLGTFDTIEAAAEAYDAATLRWRDDPAPELLNAGRTCTCDLATLL